MSTEKLFTAVETACDVFSPVASDCAPLRLRFSGVGYKYAPRMKSHLRFLSFFAGAAVFAAATATLSGAADKAKYSVSDVMKAVHKGDDNIGKRVGRGMASQEDIAKMVEHYESLPLNEPPRGDKKEWAERTKKLVMAGKAVKSGAPGALDQYKEAANCKACHDAHRPEKK
jgi:hypothetical protein